MCINVKVLAYKRPQRYAVRRALRAALTSLRASQPELQVEICEIHEISEIQKYTPVVIYPSLMINERLVCVGRIPKKDEIISWVQLAI